MSPRTWLAALIRHAVHRFGYEIVPRGSPVKERFDSLIRARDEYRRAQASAGEVSLSPSESLFVEFCAKHALTSTAQMFQDVFVLFMLAEKTEGFFVEFGATDGVYLSNSWLLESKYRWGGILAEPGKVWHSALSKNRSCAIDTRCVWSTSGEMLSFNEVTKHPGLSTIDRFSQRDLHGPARQRGQTYLVESVSLNDLLLQHGAPRVIDFLSIDTEGSELEILSALDFEARSFSVITVEHNGAANRQAIYEFLTQRGYARVFERFSRADDWYVRGRLQLLA